MFPKHHLHDEISKMLTNLFKSASNASIERSDFDSTNIQKSKSFANQITESRGHMMKSMSAPNISSGASSKFSLNRRPNALPYSEIGKNIKIGL